MIKASCGHYINKIMWAVELPDIAIDYDTGETEKAVRLMTCCPKCYKEFRKQDIIISANRMKIND